jgi:hypothetical protein
VEQPHDQRGGACGPLAAIAVVLLLLLLGFVGLFAFRFAGRSSSVVAYLEIRPRAGESETVRSAEELERRHTAIRALLKSGLVVSEAASAPGVAQLPSVMSQSNPVAWLQQRLQIVSVQNAPILELRLAGPNPDEDVQMMTALLKSFQAKLAAHPNGADVVKVIQLPLVVTP